MIKSFDLADVLSVCTGICLPSPGRESPMEGVFAVTNHVSGQSLTFLQMATENAKVAAALKEQHSFLGTIPAPDIPSDISKEEVFSFLVRWVDGYKKIHGDRLDIASVEDYGHVSPLDGIPDGTRIVVVGVPDREK